MMLYRATLSPCLRFVSLCCAVLIAGCSGNKTDRAAHAPIDSVRSNVVTERHAMDGVSTSLGTTDTAWMSALSSRHPELSDWGVDSLIRMNLDEDPQQELLCLFDTFRDTTRRKLRDGVWRYEQRIVLVDSTEKGLRVVLDEEVFGSVPEPATIGIFNSSVRSPAFFAHEWLERGSGANMSVWTIYRLTEGIAHKSHRIIDESGLGMCASLINQEVTGKVNQKQSDHMQIIYRYSFYPNSCIQDTILGGQCSGESRGDIGVIPVISRTETLTYVWSDSTNRFEPQFAGTQLSREKLRCFLEWDIDDDFIAAFREDLIAVAKSPDRCRAGLAEFLLGVGRE